MNSTGTINIPSTLISKSDLAIGEVLVFRPLTDLKALDKAQELIYGWHDDMACLLNKEYVVTQEMIDYVGERIAIETINEWNHYVGISMLTRKQDTDIEGDESMTERQVLKPSIRKKQDPAILEEMKALIDKKRLRTLLSISASTSQDTYFVNNDVLEKYLDIWAKAKYDFYLLFGKSLTHSTSVEVALDDKEITEKIRAVCEDFPAHSLLLEQFYAEEYRENQIKQNHRIAKYATSYKIGMKLSKFFTSLVGDSNLDIAISKIMQDKTAVHNVHVSIDPYDYLTMSLNKHDWDSCHRITDGCYGTGPLSYMLDDTTMIAYRENGREYDYSEYNLKFKGNSKSWRQCVYFDKDHSCMIFGRQYPNEIDKITKTIRTSLEDLVSEYIQAPNNLWTVSTKTMNATYDDKTCLHYSDVTNDYNYKFVMLKDITTPGHFEVGNNKVPCLKCEAEGEMSDGTTGLCDDCRCGDED